MAMQKAGLSLDEHRSQPVRPELIHQADLIIPMTRDHAHALETRYPEAAEKIRLLASFGTDDRHVDIRDPFGASTRHYQTISQEIEGYIADLTIYLHRNHSGGNNQSTETKGMKQ